MSQIFPATEQESQLVGDMLRKFNHSKVPFHQNKSIIKNYVIKEGDNIVAGINAFVYNWGILYIDILFIAESHRGQGLGTKLLRKVEIEAIKDGATLAHLDTFDFQAKDFYLKQGYEIFGTLDDCPPGHQRFYLKKYLTKKYL